MEKEFKYRNGVQANCKECSNIPRGATWKKITNQDALDGVDTAVDVLNKLENFSITASSNLVHVRQHLIRLINEEEIQEFKNLEALRTAGGGK